MIDSNFVYALTLLAAGKKVAREVWDDETYLEMRDGDLYKITQAGKKRCFYLDIEDLLADDWQEYSEREIDFMGVRFALAPWAKYLAVGEDSILRQYSKFPEEMEDGWTAHGLAENIDFVDLRRVDWRDSRVSIRDLTDDPDLDLTTAQPHDVYMKRDGATVTVVCVDGPNLVTSGGVYYSTQLRGRLKNHVRSCLDLIKLLPERLPHPGTKWSYDKRPERVYEVIAIANYDHRHPKYPVTVVYAYDGRYWTRPLEDFKRNFTQCD